MNLEKTKNLKLPIITPDVFGDDRGFFMETWQHNRYKKIGIDNNFVQDNLSYSRKAALRGLHLQNPHSQGKLVYVLSGEVFDVAVDVRIGSPTFCLWDGVLLTSDNKKQFYIPPGFAHGFCVVSETALFCYKCTDYYSPDDELTIIWNDPDINIKWPISNPVLSNKDKEGKTLKNLSKDLCIYE